jgi:putative DNA primase/helicase
MSTVHAATTPVNGQAGDQPFGNRQILPHHLAELRASGLTDETIAAARIYSETNHNELARTLNWNSAHRTRVPAIVFPFWSADGRPTDYARAKLDSPRTIKGKLAKYESPREHRNEVYIPPLAIASLADATIPILISEGEKKTLKATQEGFPCIGLVGIFGWKQSGTEQLHPSMARIAWQGRDVFIVFDSDRETNAQIRDAESRLALQLQRRGANVKIVHIPPGQPDADGNASKVGLDDFLVAQGAAALRELIANATDPEPPPSDQLRVPARQVDPRDEVRRYIDSQRIDGLPRTIFWRGVWWWWVDGRYVELSDNDVRCQLVQHTNQRLCMLRKGDVSNFMLQLEAQAAIAPAIEPPCWLGSPPRDWQPTEIIACKNQIIHLPSLVQRRDFAIPATPQLFTPAAIDIDFNSLAPRPNVWLRFLDQLWHDDHASIETLQEVIGYLLLPDTKQQRIFLMVGPPRSGKGLIRGVITNVVGAKNVVNPSLESLTKDFGLAPLLGKTVAVIADARLANTTNRAGVLEKLLSISGEDDQTINRKFESSVNTKLLTRFVIMTNELPALPDPSGAISSRFLISRMTQNWIGREDRTLARRLFAERSGILLWAIEGWRRLQERGHFVEPTSAGLLRDDMDRLTRPLHIFIRECCVVGPDQSVDRKQIYQAYRQWCGEHGVYVKDEAHFGRDLRAALPNLGESQPRDGEGRHRHHVGIGLRANAQSGVAHVPN